MSNFRIALTAIFAIFIVVGVIMFSLSRGGSSGAGEEITLWGTIPESLFVKYLDSVNLNRKNKVLIKYVAKEASSFDAEFVEALASGTGPDAILLPQDSILRHKDKIYPIPYGTLSERAFKDTFIQEAELYLFPEGIIALPFTIDPLVMYWNRDIFTDALMAQAPSYWDEFPSLVGKITKVDSQLNILRSAAALGEFRNIASAKEIISMLIFQAGNPIVKNDNGKTTAVLSDRMDSAIPPSEAALRFYAEFSNPSKTSYSWNRALPLSTSYFLSGDLAVYFGFASEFDGIKIKNPNLNFDVAVVPQRRGANTKTTFGAMQGFALVKSSKKLSSAWSAISTLANKDNLSLWTKTSGLPPVRRDLLSAGSADPVGSVFYASAIISKGWLDPNKEETNAVFQNMVESIISGKSMLDEAVHQADLELQSILPQK
ncbi:MAG: extracellular solute-binding protein [Patescibacteria group bacterium]|nr:extracellular solute-binding protein [Patescibacteria group bacterium]MDE1988157.1 extracellular solute-binding protein [Patescibacteria group bacterium]MDE2217977.1 extracellular solute-binding protein [Patescibacteria group bacterium]